MMENGFDKISGEAEDADLDIAKESIRLLIKTSKQYLRINNSLISDIQCTEPLSVQGFSKLDRGGLVNAHISRSLNMMEFLMGFGRSTDELNYKCFDIRQMTESLKETVENILSACVNLSIECSYKLKKSSDNITVDRDRLELIVYNIIYYCLGIPDFDAEHKKKIEFRVTEKEGEYVFTVKNIDVPLSRNAFERYIFSDSVETDNVPVLSGMDMASLLLAKKLAESTNYKINFRRNKNSSYYSLIIPKAAPVTVFSEIISFTPDISFVYETFSDILLRSKKFE